METRGTTTNGDHGQPGPPERVEAPFEPGRRWGLEAADAGDPAAPGPCPDSETLAAFVDGRLDAAGRADVAAHVAQCHDCLFVVGESGRFLDSGSSEGVASGPRRWTPGVLAVASTLAAAAALVLAVWLLRPPGYASQVQSIYAALGERRPASARLSDLPFAPPPSVTRGTVAGGPSPAGRNAAPLDLLVAAARVEERAAGDATAEGRWALGVARLVAGDLDEAVTALEAAAALRPQDARLAVDLSAALLTRAERTGDAASAARGLAEAERALALAPSSREARFNRALALEYLVRPDEAALAWRDYVAEDPNSPWATEVRRDRLR
jgi:Putative zinc-finger